MTKIKRHLLPGKVVILLAFAGLIACGGKVGTDDRASGPPANGAIRLSIAKVVAVSSVDVTISGGGLTSPIMSTLQKTPNSDYYQGLFENIPAGDHYMVSVVASTTTDAYAGSKAELSVLPGQTTNVTIYLQKQGTTDQTAPIITSVSFISDSGMDFFYALEQGTFTVATKFADTFTWSALGGAFAANNLATVRYTASATVASDTVTILVANSANGKTAQRSLNVPMREHDGSIAVTVFFAPEITDVSALSGSFMNTAGEVMELTAVSDPVVDSASSFIYAWSTTCAGITVNNGSSDATFRFTFTGLNATPADCLATVSLQEKDALGLATGLPFSQVIYHLAYAAQP